MLSQEEFNGLKEVLSTITTHIPEHQAGYIWDMYNKVDGNHGSRPCMCGSAARHWKAAVDSLNNYIKKNG
jgi:hypothetical protein